MTIRYPNYIKKNIYYSLVYPHLLYSIQVWGSAFDTNINKLIVLQKKTVRMMTFNENPIGFRGPSAHTSPLFSELSILKLKDIYDLQLMCFVYDCLYGIIMTMQHTHTANIETGSNKTILGNHLFVPYARTTGIRSIRVKASAHWNKSPQTFAKFIPWFCDI